MENERMPLKVVIEMYKHKIEVTVEKVTPENAFGHINSDTLDGYAIRDILEQLKDNAEEGLFAGDTHIHLRGEDYGETLAEFSGSWRILPDLEFIRRILRWRWNHDHDNGISKELFTDHFGRRMGDHYFSKWRSNNRDLMRMFEYYGENTAESMRFLEMVMGCVREYERRHRERRENRQ